MKCSAGSPFSLIGTSMDRNPSRPHVTLVAGPGAAWVFLSAIMGHRAISRVPYRARRSLGAEFELSLDHFELLAKKNSAAEVSAPPPSPFQASLGSSGPVDPTSSNQISHVAVHIADGGWLARFWFNRQSEIALYIKLPTIGPQKTRGGLLCPTSCSKSLQRQA